MTLYPEEVTLLAEHPRHFGRMNDPTGSARVRGLCGDEMEFYLEITHGIIDDVKFYTQGCAATVACGEMTARLVHHTSVDDALGLSPKEIKMKLGKLPDDHSHCPILAVSALYRACADYLLSCL